jgi:tetratricopeptide (TPR) repeat protein
MKRGRPQEGRRILEESVSHLDATLEIDPHDPATRESAARQHATLSIALSQSNEPGPAEGSLRRSIALNHDLVADFPREPRYRRNLAEDYANLVNVLAALGKTAELEEAYREAVQGFAELAADFPSVPVYPQSLARLRWNRGLGLRDQGRYREADQEFSEALRLFEALAAADSHRADLRKDRDEKSVDFARFLIACPDARVRNASRAVSLAEKAAASDPNNGDYWNVLGVSRYHAEDWRGAILALEKASQREQGRNPDPTGRLHLAMAHWQCGERARARAVYKDAIDWIDRNRPADNGLKRLRDEVAALFTRDEPAKKHIGKE